VELFSSFNLLKNKYAKYNSTDEKGRNKTNIFQYTLAQAIISTEGVL
jgi:hypothetical protein